MTRLRSVDPGALSTGLHGGAAVIRKSCDECSRKKRKCDGKAPCSLCIKVGMTCHYSVSHRGCRSLGKSAKGPAKNVYAEDGQQRSANFIPFLRSEVARPSDGLPPTPASAPAPPPPGVEVGEKLASRSVAVPGTSSLQLFNVSATVDEAHQELMAPTCSLGSSVASSSNFAGADDKRLVAIGNASKWELALAAAASSIPDFCSCRGSHVCASCIRRRNDAGAESLSSRLQSPRSISPSVGIGPYVGIEGVVEGTFLSSFCSHFNRGLKIAMQDEINKSAIQVSGYVTGDLSVMGDPDSMLARDGFFWAAVALGSFIEGCDVERVDFYVRKSRNSLMRCFDKPSLLTSLAHAVLMCLYDVLGLYEEGRTSGLLARANLESDSGRTCIALDACTPNPSAMLDMLANANVLYITSIVTGLPIPSSVSENVWSPIYSPMLKVRAEMVELLMDHKSRCAASESELVQKLRADDSVMGDTISISPPLGGSTFAVRALLLALAGDIEESSRIIDSLIESFFRLKRLIMFRINLHCLHVVLVLCLLLRKFDSYDKLSSFYNGIVYSLGRNTRSCIPPREVVTQDPYALCPSGVYFCHGVWDIAFGPREGREGCCMIQAAEVCKQKLKS